MQEEWELEEVGIDWLHVRSIWSTITRRKWAILALAVVVTLVTAMLVYTMTPMYSANALVHIESRQANIVSIEEVYGVGTRDQDYYNTQVEILKSRPIAAKVIETVGAPPDATPSLIGRLTYFLRSLVPFKPPEPPGGPLDLDEHEADIDNYLQGLWIDRIRDTQLVNVGYDSEDPRLAAANANAHAAAYIASLVDSRLSVTRSALTWMAERVEELRTNLLDSEAELQAFREQEKLIDVEGFQALPTQEVNDLSTRLVNAKRRLSATNIAYQQVYGNDSSAIESVPAVLENSAAQQFRAIQALAEQEIAELGKTYGPKHPKMIAAQSKLAEATQNLEVQHRDIAGGIRAQQLAAQAEVAALEADLASAKQQYQEVTRKGSTLASLKQKVDTNRELYELFYRRMNETAQTGDLESANASIVQPAVVPRHPHKPNKTRAIILAFLLSLIAGVGAAFLLEQLNNTIRSSTDVEDKIGLPLMGALPLLVGKGHKPAELGLLNEAEKGFGEAVRTIRTGISLSSPDNPPKVILVTSSVSLEGKSTVAMNLALAFAQGERVLLVDADMRRPSVARNLNLGRSQPGLSELLADQAGIKDCVIALEKYKLDVITTGMIPPDPLRLLSSAAISQLMEQLRGTYDRVIIDSPPILLVSDSAVLSTHVDSLLYVIKANATSVRQIKSGLKLLQRFKAPTGSTPGRGSERRATDYYAGAVVNQVDLREGKLFGDFGYYGVYGEDYQSESNRKNAPA